MPERGFSEIPQDELTGQPNAEQAASQDSDPAASGQPRRISRRAFAAGALAVGVGAATGARRVAAEQPVNEVVDASSRMSEAVQDQARKEESFDPQAELLPNVEDKELIDYLEQTRAKNLPPVDLFKIHTEYSQAGADPNAMTPPELALIFELDNEGYVVVRYHYVGLEAKNFIFYLKQSEDGAMGGRGVVVEANHGEYRLKDDEELQALFHTDDQGQVHYSGDVVRAVAGGGADGFVSLASSDRKAGLGLTGEIRKVTLEDLKAQTLGKAAEQSMPKTDDKGRKLVLPGRMGESEQSTAGGFHDPSPLVGAAGTGGVATAAYEMARKRPEGGWRGALKRIFGSKETEIKHAQLPAADVKVLDAPSAPQALEAPEVAALSAPAAHAALDRPVDIPALPDRVGSPATEVEDDDATGRNNVEDEPQR